VETGRQRGASHFCQNTKRDRGKRSFERYYRNGSSPWFRKIKMNRSAFVSINHMTGGHSILKASLSSFNIVIIAECKCGDGLQTGEFIFWDCKLYEDQRATMMDFCLRTEKKIPMSVIEVLRLEEKRFVQVVCYFLNKIPILI
jgi:hypothetical protein